MSIVALAALVPVLVGLPPGAVAPAPGSLPPGARVEALDPALGIVRVDLPRAGLARSVARLKAAPGTRYVEADEPLALAGKGGDCPGLGKAKPQPSPGWWKTAVNLPPRNALPSVASVVIGVADTGADLERLGERVGNAISRDFTDGKLREDVSDEIGHGTLVASLIAADRKNDGVEGVAVGAPLAVARVARQDHCGLDSELISAMAWFRTVEHPSVVSVSIVMKPKAALRRALRALQLEGTLVVAAAGNNGTNRTELTFPWKEPGVLAVGSVKSRTAVAFTSTRSTRLDLVAPGPGVPAISAATSKAPEKTTTPDGTSYATPIVAAAAALVIAKHPTWSPDDVAAALRQSARLRPGLTAPDPAWGWGVLDVTKALRIAPKLDCRMCEPNGWAAAAAKQASMLPPGRKSASIRARIGEGGDLLDLYPVRLGGGQRLTAKAQTAGARVRMSLWTKTGRTLGDWSDEGGTTSLTARAPAPGVYLVAVQRRSGYGSYRLSLAKG